MASSILNAYTVMRVNEELQHGIDFCENLKAAIIDCTNFMMKKGMIENSQVDVNGDGGAPAGVKGALSSSTSNNNNNTNTSSSSSNNNTNSNSNNSKSGNGGKGGSGKSSAAQAKNASSSDKGADSDKGRSRGGGGAGGGAASNHSQGSKQVANAPIPIDTDSGPSTLRKNRRTRGLPSTISPLVVNEPLISTLAYQQDVNYLKQINEKGERILTKREVSHRAFEMTRFRPLEPGDFCCCKLQSDDDMWMLGKVLRHWNPPPNTPFTVLVDMPASQRNQVLAKVIVADADVESGAVQVEHSLFRDLVIPLPRTYLEAAYWGARCKKQTKILAIYPQTTSLYTANVVDSHTYCSGDDDIIVCEFDGDEDETGIIPQKHIPARHCTLVPKEFSTSAGNKRKRRRK